MKLSIIVPIYGVEQYIEKCLISCVQQDARIGVDYEIICVNDGTKDQSAAIAKEISSKYEGIVVIDQENQGLSVARNTGFDNAQGDYIWYVDSDDWISECCLGRIMRKLTDDIDILQLQYRLAYDDDIDQQTNVSFTDIDGIKTGYEVTLQGGLPAPAQFSIYRRKYLSDNNLKFVKGIYHEDSEFKPRAVYLAQKIASDTEVSYNYYQRTSGSIMSSFSVKRAADILYVNNSLHDFSKDLDEEIQKAINIKIGLNFNSLFYGYWRLSRKDRKEVRDKIAQNKHLLQRMINCYNIKYRLEGYLFAFNINLALLIYKLLKK